MINIKRLRGVDVSQKIQDQCFTAEQKAILEYTQGTIQINIKDQLDRFYGDRFLIKDEENTIKEAAQIIHEYDFLIQDISELKQKILRLKNPESYRATTSTLAKGVGCSKSASEVDSLNAHKTISFVNTESSSGSYTRNINSEPVKLIQGLDVLPDNKRISKEAISKKARGFSSSTLSKDTFMNVDEQQVVKTPIVTESDNYQYHNQILTKVGELADSAVDTFMDDRRINDTKSNSKTTSANTTDTKTIIDIESDPILKSLTIEIPKIRSKFWNKFSLLYTFCEPC